MTLKEFIKNLQIFAKENPEALSKRVIHSSDDEGNSFHTVIFTPTKAIYLKDERYIKEPEEGEEYDSVVIN